MKFFSTLLLLAVLAQDCIGQDWYDTKRNEEKCPGWVLLSSGDTLHGKIEYNHPARMTRKVIFWDDKNPTDRQKFKARDKKLKAYFYDGVLWEALKLNDGSIKLSASQSETEFLRVVANGRLKVCEQYTMENDKFIESEGNTITILAEELKITSFISKDGGKLESLTHIKFLNYKKGMGKLVSDCESVAKKVESKEYGRLHFYKMVAEYNEVCGQK
ncbi:MAG: hypothetical protein ACKVU0_04275 [Saprospiraceae bacterium]